MCGITGFINQKSFTKETCQSEILKITNTLKHRGPNDSGIWVSYDNKIALGHRRLSIIDLSSSGHQPMHSATGRFVIVYNGEIYNYLELKKELELLGYIFKSHSDTEVILNCLYAWGLEKSLQKFNGMFAFALWDNELKKLFLARDRFGEKPLYYGFIKNTFIFASELKAIKSHSDFNSDIDLESLSQYLHYCYVPAPHSIYKNIKKLTPGTYISINSINMQISEPNYYWRIIDSINQKKIAFHNQDAIETAHQLLKNSVKSRMISDVPIGVFLSGGIDSSLITALMQENSSTPIKSFTIGFNENEYNEAIYAKKVAERLGTHHTEHYVSANEALEVIPLLSNIYDEPFADSSQIPTYLVSKITKQYVSVCLSGDGGDEIFGGYNRYLFINHIWNKVNLIPYFMRPVLAKILTSISPERWNKLPNKIKKLLPTQNLIGERIHKFSPVLLLSNHHEIYSHFISLWNSRNIMLHDVSRADKLNSLKNHCQSFTEEMMYLDTINYLPDDILVKVDRASMANSLETRAPFLDSHCFEYAWSLPLNMKINRNETKWILKQILKKYLPENLINRPKMGFGIPLNSWLRNQLRDWAENLLDKNKMDQQGFLNSKVIHEKWREHLSGKKNWQHHIWVILMFQQWLENN